MCGLIGYLAAPAAADQLPETRAAIEASLTQMRHRGPDDSGTWSDDEAVIGFRRLSLIDWEHSHQPLPYLAQRYQLIFNGEIYNYLELRERLETEFGATFETKGDGEAILAGYHYLGERVVDELRGMFAFLIWDSEERVLFGARDPFGIKPLYTYTDERGSFFASEKKALLAVAPEIAKAGDAAVNTEALQHYLTLQYVPEPASMHRQITRIDSGTCFTLRPGGVVETRRYFTPDFPIRPVSEPDKLYHEIAEVLRDSVAKHLRSDFTVGSFLSGGIDSTAIAALASEHNPNLLTFTTGFEREGFSEIDVAAESAAAIGVRHIVKVVTPQEMMDTLPLIVWYLDDPVADPALVPLYFIAREARKHVKVVLSGEGADELFGGYTIYREPISLRRLTARPDPVGGCSVGLSAGCRRACAARTCCAGPRSASRSATTATPGSSAGRAGRRCCGPTRPTVSYTDVTARALRGDPAPGRLDPDAVRRPVHLAARRHPGQGRQDDDGQLAGAAGAVPGPRGVPGGLGDPGGAEDHLGDDQVRAAPGAGRDRPGARAEPGQARLPGADPAVAAGRDVRVGARHHGVCWHGSPDRHGGGVAVAGRAPGRAARLLAQDLDAAGVHDLARHLRRGPDPPEMPQPVYPVKI